MSLTNNLKKITASDHSLLQDIQPTRSPQRLHKAKSRSIVKMPAINPSSPLLNNQGISKNALLKVSQRRTNPLQTTIIHLKPQSFSHQPGEDSITSLKGVGSSNTGKVKYPSLAIDTTTAGSNESKSAEDFEELEGFPSPASPAKKQLHAVTSNLIKTKHNESHIGFSHNSLDTPDLKMSSSDVALKKVNAQLSALIRTEKVRSHRPIIGNHSFIGNTGNMDGSPILKPMKHRNFEDNNEEENEEFEIPDIGSTKHSLKENGSVKAYGANTNQGLVRNYNEDRVSIILNISKPADSTYQGTWPTCSYFAVYDGHGGDACSNFLRDYLHQMIVRNSSFPLDPIAALKKGFAEAEAKFLEEADQEDEEVERSGSCAIVVLIVDDMCYVANVGDSRAVMSCDKGNRVVNLSRDHKPSDQDEQARIIRNGGRVYQSQVTHQVKSAAGSLGSNFNAVVLGPHRVFPGRLSVSRTFGDIEAKFPKYDGLPGVIVAEPEIKSFKITDECDFIVLASDGIYDRLSSEDVSRCVWNSTQIRVPHIHQQAAAGVELIMKQALLKKTTDNITTVLIALNGLKAAFYDQNNLETEVSIEKNASSLSPLRTKKKTNNRSLDLENDMSQSVRSTKKRFTDSRRTDNVIKSKKGQEIIDQTEDLIHKNIIQANLELKKNRFHNTTNRSTDLSGTFFSSPRVMKLNKVSLAGIK